ncbi:MAG: hypothetical protein JNJ83_11125 [Verrucomicrobiaceae bacterium]|nr:hypothetical protein [Verrucomicrobiaceae bacterium]
MKLKNHATIALLAISEAAEAVRSNVQEDLKWRARRPVWAAESRESVAFWAKRLKAWRGVYQRLNAGGVA